MDTSVVGQLGSPGIARHLRQPRNIRAEQELGAPAERQRHHSHHGQPFDFNRTPGNLLGVDTPRKELRVAALLFAVIAVILAVAAAVLTRSLDEKDEPVKRLGIGNLASRAHLQPKHTPDWSRQTFQSRVA